MNSGAKNGFLVPSQAPDWANPIKTVSEFSFSSDSTQRHTSRPSSVFHVILSVLICFSPFRELCEESIKTRSSTERRRVAEVARFIVGDAADSHSSMSTRGMMTGVPWATEGL
jgi:hypothetical protein